MEEEKRKWRKLWKQQKEKSKRKTGIRIRMQNCS